MAHGKKEIEIVSLDAAGADARIAELAGLLEDAVEGGASVGFLPPLSTFEAMDYWRGVIDGLRRPDRILLVAVSGGSLVGAVQLVLEQRANGSHRAEVAKLMVHTSHRRGGIGRALIERAEGAALAAGRTTLVLDTREGDPSERLYLGMGYIKAGAIPRYARSAGGQLHTTAFFYKLLPGHSGNVMQST